MYSKEPKAGTQTDIYTPMFTAALFTKAKRWKQLKYPLMDEWVNKMWRIHTMEYYSAFKRKRIPMHATTRVKLENIMRSEISQIQKNKYYLIPLI